MSVRDTRFLGFAALLWDELHTLYLADTADKTDPEHEEMRARYEQMDKQLIARRAYDLVKHTLDNIWEVHNPEILIGKTPDLTAWPEDEVT